MKIAWMFDFTLPDKQRVTAVTVSPDDAYVAAIHTDRSVSTVLLWLLREPAPPNEIYAGPTLDRLAWSSDSRFLAGVSHAGEDVTIHDVAKDKPLSIKTPAARSIAFSGTLLAVADKRVVQVWNVATKKRVWQLKDVPEDHDGALAAALSPDGTQIAIAGFPDATLQIYALASSKLVRSFPIAMNSACEIEWSANGRYVAIKEFYAYTGDAAYDVSTGKPLPLRVSGRFRFDRAGEQLVVSGRDIAVHALPKGRVIYSLKESDAPAGSADFTRDGKHLVIGSGKEGRGTLRIVPISNRAAKPVKAARVAAPKVKTFAGEVHAIDIADDGTIACTLREPPKCTLELWSPGFAKRLARVTMPDFVDDVAALDGKRVAFHYSTARADGDPESVFGIWDRKSPPKLHRRDGDGVMVLARRASRAVVRARGAKEVVVLDVATGKVLWKCPDRVSPHFGSPSIDDRGERVAVLGTRAGQIARYTVGGPKDKPLPDAPQMARKLRYSPDGSYLGLLDSNGIWLWDLAARTRILPDLFRENAKGNYATLAVGTSLVATSDSSGRLQVVRLPGGERVVDKRLGTRAASSIAFGPDGALLVAVETKVYIYKI